jgi:hypothetical protein
MAARQPNGELGFWKIPQSLAWIMFRDPDHPIPDREKSAEDAAFDVLAAMAHNQPTDLPPQIDRGPLRHVVDQLVNEILESSNQIIVAVVKEAQQRQRLRELLSLAEATLVGYYQSEKIVPRGRPQPELNSHRLLPADHVEIAYLALLGEVTLSGPICPPSQSYLVARDPACPGANKVWRDVLTPAKQLKSLNPTPLVLIGPAREGEKSSPAVAAWLDVASEPRSARTDEIHKAISAVYDFAEARNMKPPNVEEIAAPVLKYLKRQGLIATASRIKELAAEPRHKSRRRPVGQRTFGTFSPFSDLKM